MRIIRLCLATLVARATCDAALNGKLSFYTSSWESWDENIARWSTYEAPTFSAIFKPEMEAELAQGIEYLARHKIPYLATKPGGHGNVPTLGTYQNVVQINMDNFRHAIVNPDHSITIGGGTKMEDLIPTLHAAGREMTVGSFPCVGVHGVMLGGGMGRLMGRYGLISDAMLRAKVVLWNGTIVEASEKANSDLFWGLRGAGHNLGVVVESTYKTWPDEGGLHYNADMVFTDDSVHGVVETARNIIEDGLDPSLFLILGYVYDAEAKKPLLIVNLVYAHNEEEGRKVAQKFASSPKDATNPTTRLSFRETTMDFSELGSGKAIPGVCDVNLKNTLYTASSPTMFDADAMKAVYESFGSFVREHPSANRSIVLFEAASGQAMESLPQDYSAYAHRGKMTTNAIIQATWDMDLDGSVANAASSWGKGARDLLAKPEVSGYDKLYAYVNYANKDEPLAALYGYGKKRQQRLTSLKKKYDPHGFFNAYRPLPLEMSGWDLLASSKASQSDRDEL
ncbi:putative FAD-binding PCMH-type domain-containing protein [Seiridium cardinale]|uniref:FAD-binding PCMH-type domain-containing protein n=1 Tax=Seiridium cardinale TaxID=138064 RepID=A0ABR2XU69_9PEZI